MIDNNYYYNYDNNYNKIFTIAGMHFYFCFYMIPQLFIQHFFQVLVRQLRPMRLIKDHRVIFFFIIFLESFLVYVVDWGGVLKKRDFPCLNPLLIQAKEGRTT